MDALFDLRLTSTEHRIYMAMVTKPALGIRELAEKMELKKSSIYSAKSKLTELGYLPITNSNILESDSNILESNSNILESDSNILESNSNILESNSNILESDSNILESDSNILESNSNILECPTHDTPPPNNNDTNDLDVGTVLALKTKNKNKNKSTSTDSFSVLKNKTKNKNAAPVSDHRRVMDHLYTSYESKIGIKYSGSGGGLAKRIQERLKDCTADEIIAAWDRWLCEDQDWCHYQPITFFSDGVFNPLLVEMEWARRAAEEEKYIADRFAYYKTPEGIAERKAIDLRDAEYRKQCDEHNRQYRIDATRRWKERVAKYGSKEELYDAKSGACQYPGGNVYPGDADQPPRGNIGGLRPISETILSVLEPDDIPWN